MNTQMTKEFFERIETEVENSLRPQGYRKTKQQTHLHGNMYSVFESDTRLTRVIWDAKDRRFIVRLYKKGSWFMKLGKALIGRNDDERMLKELIVKNEELMDSTEEQVVNRILETVSTTR